jgi:hypothetical protein
MHTRNNITSIHRIVILDEPESVHELDFGDVTGSMSFEMFLNIFLGN